MNKLNAAIANLVMAAMLVASMPAHAAIVGTEQMVTQETRAASLAKVETFMASEQVAAQLEAWGVAPEVVSARVAALSDAELQQLAANMETDPAGGVLVLIGVIFVVLIILEIVGVTNIFNRV
ncbi:MAG TPA: PA2779 family protein [Gammaproteobacteria bacterium]|nr:PA2779 family protein [Gammaproteobacteria bacterium]